MSDNFGTSKCMAPKHSVLSKSYRAGMLALFFIEAVENTKPHRYTVARFTPRGGLNRGINRAETHANGYRMTKIKDDLLK